MIRLSGRMQSVDNAAMAKTFRPYEPDQLLLMPPSNRVKLQSHVGHRDALTGTIENGAMRVQSVRHLAASCGE